MNMQSISFAPSSSRVREDARLTQVNPLRYAGALARWSLAGSVALAVIIPGIWLATNPATAEFLSAGLWAMGFVFFALALEVNIGRIFPLIATGIALPALALLGSRVTEEFSILAVALVAAWLAAWIGRRR